MVFSTKAARWLLLALLLGGALASRAQIVDDSTKTVYGPKTTRVIYEAELLRDSTGGTSLDTSLTKWPQARFWAHDSTFQQDLGVLASASKPLLYQPNYQLGARFGRHAFDRQVRTGSRVPYYDSRSPYSFFRYVQGSLGEQVFEISYSRSLKKNFSVGVDYERIAGNQTVGVNSSQYQTEHNNFTIFGRYQTEDGRYHLLANYAASRQQTRELGGIWPTKNEHVDLPKGDSSLFKYGDQRVYLAPGINIDDRDQVHVFQSYRLLGRGLTAYHILDISRQYNGYNDDALPREASGQILFYPRNLGSPNAVRNTFRNVTATNDRALFRQVENTGGLLGRTDRVEYNLYARVRNASFTAQSTQPGLAGPGVRLDNVARYQYNQVFFGGTAAFNYRTIYAVDVAGEYKLFDEYWLRGRIRTGPLSAEVLTTSYSPTLTQQLFIGNHYEWHHLPGDKNSTNSPFSNTATQQLTVRLKQRLPFLAEHSIEASAAFVNLSNLVYYGPNGTPQQLGDSQGQQLLIGFARHRVRVGNVFFDNQATFTQGASGDTTGGKSANPGLRIPTLVTESRVYYQRLVFGRALFAQVGGEVYYQSSFKGYDYAPSTQQFYVQDHFTIGNYAVVNAFVAADISSASVFVKMSYLNQGFQRDGYFTTPFYAGYPRRLIFGVRWRFFS